MSDTVAELPTEITESATLSTDSKGAGDRFNEAKATREKSAAEIEAANDVTTKLVETERPKVEKEVAKPDVDKKTGIPDFGKKAEKQETKEQSQEESDAEYLKKHPAIKGEAAKSWLAIKHERDAAAKEARETKAQIESLNLKIKEIEGKSAPNKDQQEALVAYEKRAKELEEELGKANFERTPRYRAYLEDEAREIKNAKSYLDGDDAKQAAIEAASNLTGAKRLSVLRDSGMDAEQIAAITAHLASVDRIRAGRMGELDNWRSRQAEEQTLAQRQQQEEAARIAQQEEQLFKTVFEKEKTNWEPFMKVDGYEDWNKEVDRIESEAGRLFSGKAKLDELASVVTAGLAAPGLRKMMVSLQEKYNLIAEENERLKSGVKNGATVKTGETNPDEGTTVASRFNARLGLTDQR